MQTEKAENEKRLWAHWGNFLERFAIPNLHYEVFDEIRSRYEEEHRSYHGLAHPVVLLDELHDLRRARSGLFLDTEEDLAIELAIWDHDLVYDAQAKDNENRSADRAFVHAQMLGFHERIGTHARRLVIATKHTDVHKELATQIVTDIDLSPLAAAWNVFAQNSLDIRTEYAHVSDDDFKRGRRNFLLGMLERPRIFSTDYYLQKSEAAARANLKRSLREQYRS